MQSSGGRQAEETSWPPEAVTGQSTSPAGAWPRRPVPTPQQAHSLAEATGVVYREERRRYCGSR